MNRLPLALVLALLCFSAYAQQVGDSAYKQVYYKALSQFQPTGGATRTLLPKRLPTVHIPPDYFRKEGAAKLPVLKQLAQTGTPVSRVNATCEDTSFSRLYAVENSAVYVYNVSKTRGGDLLVTGEIGDTTAANPKGTWCSYIMKLDDGGNILWLKSFEEFNPGWSAVGSPKAHELNNGDIILTAVWDIDPSSTYNTFTLVLRLTSTGSMIWQTGLASNLEMLMVPRRAAYFTVETAVDGLNGDVILGGMTQASVSYAHFATVVRLNNLGRLVWDANYGNYGGDGSGKFGITGISAFMHNGQIRFVCLNTGGFNAVTLPTITFLTIDYNNGSQLAAKFFRTNYADQNTALNKSFGLWYHHVTRLDNGNLLFYGRIFGDIVNQTFKEYFGVAEFDVNLNLVNSYIIGADFKVITSNHMLYFDPSGKGYVYGQEILAAFESNVYFAAFENMQFLKQRRLHYQAAVGGGNQNGISTLAGNAYAYLQTYYDPADWKLYIDFVKMHNSDTSSDCVGKDTMMFRFLPLNLIQTNESAGLDPNWPDTLQEVPTNILVHNENGRFINRCKQTNICDSVKIHGDSKICGNQSYLDFTAYKKKVCGGIVQWNIDKSAIDSMKVLNDTTVRMFFKNINWKGKLYALLPAGACFLPAIDSMELHIIRSQLPINLGPDREMCNASPITFHAGHTFANYLWQDGSTDSTLTIAAPGKYWVTANDTCGSSFSDTVVVTAFNVPVDLGADRSKCNNDTLHLDAPAGFINYRWTNNYDASMANTQNVIVNPPVDMTYYLAAEKKPGCFSYDTIRIVVQTSPPINLGPDARFCTGDSATLDAGSSFSTYAWSNGAIGQRLIVKSSGEYSVIGTYSNGCSSYDTLSVLPPFALPVVTLDDNPLLCTDATRTLQAGNFASYLWHDGSTNGSYEASGIGEYYVTVEDNNGCKGSDTVRITQILPLPANFLPGDTSICNYANLLLRPKNNYSQYLWNTNATGVSITITQPGKYWLRVTDSHSCTGADTILVLPKECLVGLYAPNAFTPNNDRWNDTFRPILGGIVESYELSIYNRYGQKIFSTTDLHQGWDGTIAGKKQDSNSFVWTCRYKLEGQAERVERGTVTLIR